MGVKHVSNGDGTVTQFDETTGRELNTFPDPDGSFTRDYLEPAAAAASASAPTGTNADRIWARAKELAPTTQTVRPEQETITPKAPESEFQRSLRPPVLGEEPRSALPLAAEATTGLADREGYAAHLDDNARQERESNDRVTAARSQQADAALERAQAESDRALGRRAADLQLHETAKESMLEAEEEAKKARAVQIDPAQGVLGKKGFYAIMANVGAGLTNWGNALFGQGPTAKANQVDDIIQRSVDAQLRERGLGIESADANLAQRRKEELRLSIQANASLENWLQSRAAIEKDPEVRAALVTEAEARNAASREHTMKYGERLYSEKTQQRAAPKPTGPAKVDPASLYNAETKEDMDTLAANGSNPKAYAEYGAERGKLGVDVTLKHIGDVRQIVKDLKSKGSTDVAGVGPIDARAQALIRSNDASKVQQGLGMVITTFAKARSGAAVTDKEREYLAKIITGSGSNQEEGLENGLRAIEREVTEQLKVLDDTRPGEARARATISARRTQRAGLSDEQKANKQALLADDPPAPAPAAPEPGADPVKAIRTKGVSRALIDLLGDEPGEAPGSPL